MKQSIKDEIKEIYHNLKNAYDHSPFPLILDKLEDLEMRINKIETKLENMETCSQCRFQFKETSIQYYNRMKKCQAILCRDCIRISNAESTAEKRAVKQSLLAHPSDTNLERALKFKITHGIISQAFLMLKLKITSEEALKVMEYIDKL